MLFKYDGLHLPQPDQQIRLLYLVADHDDADIRVKLKVYDFGECPAFTAISYTWGDQSPTLAITINDQLFRVRLNCWYALWQMRHHQYYVLWIDCVCINQNDVLEKNAQVAIMGEIFSKADLTASCLGPGRSLAAAKSFTRSMADGIGLQAGRDLIKELQYKSYFRRIWIKQEIIKSENIRLFCGLESLEWEDYEAIADAAALADSRDIKFTSVHRKSKIVANSVHTSLIEGRRRHRQSGEEDEQSSGPWTEFWRILATYGDAECQDCHDKVYALLPLMSDGMRSQLDLPVNYLLHPLHLVLQLVEGIISKALAMEKSGANPISIPDSIWKTLVHSVRHWFCPQLSDPIVLHFADKWYKLPSAESDEDQPRFFGLTLDASDGGAKAKFCTMVVLDRYTIVGNIIDESGSIYPIWDANGDIKDEDGTNKEDSSTDDNGDEEDEDCGSHPYWQTHDSQHEWISEVMPVKNVRDYLIWLRQGLEDEPEFLQTEGEFNLFALPPDLPIRILFPSITLVSANTEIGDCVLHVEFCDPHTDQKFLPVVRSYKHLSSEKRIYSLLIGWALRLQVDGTLLTAPHTDRAAPAWGYTAFKMYYEDFILYAILLRDLAAYLSHPCTHRDHPSVMAEDLVDKRKNTADLPPWAQYEEKAAGRSQLREGEQSRVGFDDEPSYLETEIQPIPEAERTRRDLAPEPERTWLNRRVAEMIEPCQEALARRGQALERKYKSVGFEEDPFSSVTAAEQAHAPQRKQEEMNEETIPPHVEAAWKLEQELCAKRGKKKVSFT